jgi:hypothetical protein
MAEGLSRKEQIFGVKSKKTQVYNPTGAVMAERISKFAPRIDSLDGKRIGLLWNSKPNGDFYLNRVAELLSQRFPSSKIIKFYKTHAAETANPDKKSDAALDLIVQNADVVISAQGD